MRQILRQAEVTVAVLLALPGPGRAADALYTHGNYTLWHDDDFSTGGGNHTGAHASKAGLRNERGAWMPGWSSPTAPENGLT